MAITLNDLLQHFQGKKAIALNQLDLSWENLSDEEIEKFIETLDQLSFSKLNLHKINLSNASITSGYLLINFLQKICHISEIVDLDLSSNLLSHEEGKFFLTVLFSQLVMAKHSGLKQINFSDNPIENKNAFSIYLRQMTNSFDCKFILNDLLSEDDKKNVRYLSSSKTSSFAEIRNSSDLPKRTNKRGSQFFELRQTSSKKSSFIIVKEEPIVLTERSKLLPSTDLERATSNDSLPPLAGMGRRWLLRENIFKSLLEKIALSHHQEYQEKRKEISWRERFLLSHTLPLDILPPSERISAQYDQRQRLSGLKHLHRISTLHTAVNHFTNVALPIAALGLFLHDLIEFGRLPTRHYNASWGDLGSGFYRTYWGTAGCFYDGFPNEVSFWALPGSLIIAPVAMVILESILQNSYFKHPEKIYETLHSVYENSQKSVFSALLQALPYSPYHNALEAAEFLLRWDSYGGDLEKEERRLFSIVKQHAKHSIFPLAAPAISVLGNASDVQNCNGPFMEEATIQVQANQTLNELATRSAGLRRQSARYQQWTLGLPTSRSGHAIYGSRRLVAAAAMAYILYRSVAQMYYIRGQQAHEFFSNARDCHNQNRTWNYSPRGEYDCTICGDWRFVPPALTNHLQSCLDYLLSSERPWQDFFDGVERLSRFSNVSEINFSAWNISHWNETTTQNVLDAIAPLSSHWQVANFSSPTLQPVWSTARILNRVAIFLNEHTADQVDISRLNLGPQAWSSFLNNWQLPYRLTGLFSAQNGLTDQSIIDFSTWYANHSVALQQIDFSGNLMTDQGLQVLLNNLQPNQTSYLNIANNQLSGQSLSLLATWLPTSGNTQLEMGGQEFTGGDFSNFGSAIAQTPQLFSLNLRETYLDDISLLSIATWSNQSVALETLNVEGNTLTGRGIAAFGLATANQQIGTVNWSRNPIDNEGLQRIQAVLSQVTWREINISSIPIDASSLAHFWDYLPGSSIRAVTARGFNFGDEAFLPLVLSLEHQNITLDRIDLSGNRLSNELAGRLLRSACQAGVRSISLEDNRLTSMDFVDANPNNSANYSCTHFYLAGNLYRDKDVLPLIRFMPSLPLQTLDLSRSLIGDEMAFQLAQRVLSPIANPDDLMAENYPYDEDRYLDQYAHPETSLNEIILENTQITEKGKRALQRVGAHLPYTTFRISENSFGQSGTELTLFSRQALPTASTGNTPSLSAGFLLAAVPVVNTILLLFVLYRLFRSIVPTLSTHRATLFRRQVRPENNVEHTKQNLTENIQPRLDR